MKFLVHCTLINIWVRGYLKKAKAFRYTTDKYYAKRYSSRQYAKQVIERLPEAWRKHMEIIDER